MIEHVIQLRPNCLLTRLPILFVYFKKISLLTKVKKQEIQNYISAHGYTTQTLEVSGFHPHSQSKKFFSLIDRIIAANAHCHLALVSPPDEVKHLIMTQSGRIKGLNVVDVTTLNPNKALDHFIDLAEQDFLNGLQQKMGTEI